MKNIIALFFSLFIGINASFATSTEITVPSRIPDEIYISEHWVSLTTSYNIGTKTQKLGTLYRRFFSLLLTYDFYDPFDNQLAYARSKFFSFTAHFDVYDMNDNLLGAADERMFAFFPTFDIYAHDGYTKLAKARMNFWGTTFIIYDPVTDKEMAQMYRSFFRFKNDWTFKVTNRGLFDYKGIDSRVLMTVIAFQGDREYWEKKRRDEDDSRLFINSNDTADISSPQLTALIEKVAMASKQEGLEGHSEPDDKTLESVAQELEAQYTDAPAAVDLEQTSLERASSFTDYCLNLVQSNTLTDEKKKAVLVLLKTRLESVMSQLK